MKERDFLEKVKKAWAYCATHGFTESHGGVLFMNPKTGSQKSYCRAYYKQITVNSGTAFAIPGCGLVKGAADLTNCKLIEDDINRAIVEYTEEVAHAKASHVSTLHKQIGHVRGAPHDQ